MLVLSIAVFASADDSKLILGTSADNPPSEFMYLDENNEMVYGGIDVSAAGYIAEQMNRELVVENMTPEVRDAFYSGDAPHDMYIGEIVKVV